MTENEIAREIVDVAYKMHKRLGPGLFESVYRVVMVHELRNRNLLVTEEAAVPIQYDDLNIEMAFRADLIVENKVIVELKSVEQVAPVHKKTIADILTAF